MELRENLGILFCRGVFAFLCVPINGAGSKPCYSKLMANLTQTHKQYDKSKNTNLANLANLANLFFLLSKRFEAAIWLLILPCFLAI